MKLLKPKFWENNNTSILALILLPISIIIQLIMQIKMFSNSKKFNIPVICVGNIYLGGTGKTPLSIKISNIFKKLKVKNAIIKKYHPNQQDEIRLIKNKSNNLFVASTRAIAVKKAVSKNFKLAILDDGFQDNSLFKNLNILCFNENQLLGNGYTIPSGPLRENINSVKRSDIIVINGKKNKEFEKKLNLISKKFKIFYSYYKPINIKKFKNKKILAFAGIGNPENFFSLLKKYKLNVKAKIAYPDHYLYSKNELDALIKKAKKNKLSLLTTEKDYFRIKHLGFSKIDTLSIGVEIVKERDFIKELTKIL
jgi:tetraacyldisaccharide 4'-kinase|tara:strand:- start:336 stop:1265 length:930 start_codon:yes stop_codon:yes gene_type:complete